MTRGMTIFSAGIYRGLTPLNAALMAVQFGAYGIEWNRANDRVDKLADAIEAQVKRGQISWASLDIPASPRTDEIARRKLRGVIGGAALDALETATIRAPLVA